MNLEDLSPEGALTTKKSKQMFKMAILSLAPRPEGPEGGSIDQGQPPEGDLRGLRCDHAGGKQPEAKNH